MIGPVSSCRPAAASPLGRCHPCPLKLPSQDLASSCDLNHQPGLGLWLQKADLLMRSGLLLLKSSESSEDGKRQGYGS